MLEKPIVLFIRRNLQWAYVGAGARIQTDRRICEYSVASGTGDASITFKTRLIARGIS